jgi:hypothetical protein
MNRPKLHRPVFGKILLSVLVGFGLLQGIASAQTPVILQLYPDSKPVGSAGFTLTIFGPVGSAGTFVASSVARWNGSDRTTVFFTNGNLQVTIPASDLAVAGTYPVTVRNPGGLTSNAVNFTVVGLPLQITGINPSSALMGGPDFTITVSGQGFNANCAVRWNGSPRTTAAYDPGTPGILTVQILAADIATAGTASVTVHDAGIDTTSNALTFTVREPTLYFPQFAVGGNFTTIFTIINTGLDSDSGWLTLTDQAGNPFFVTASTVPPTTDFVFQIAVPARGVKILTLTSPTPGPVQAGWARITSAKNLLTGVATFTTTTQGVLNSAAGVLPAQLTHSATIPVDNAENVGRATGFAVANPGDSNINISIVVLDESGFQVGDIISPPELNPLGPHKQVARYLHQYRSQAATFKGSMILSSGDSFVSVALSTIPGLGPDSVMSVIPVILGSIIQ